MKTFDWRWLVIGVLGAVIIVFGLWRPWQEQRSRTIEVTGQAEVRAEPDQFTFRVTYQEKAETRQEAIKRVTVIGEKTITELRKIGVKESAITTTVAGGIDYYGAPSAPEIMPSPPLATTPNATYGITAVVTERALAQKVTDYLSTTNPLYSVTPEYGFSSTKQQQLENEARLLALSDGRKKAEATATTLGAKLGKIQKVSDLQWGGGVVPMARSSEDQSTSPSPTVLPGEQTIPFTVVLTYLLR